MEVEAEPKVHEQYEEYVKQVECKESDYISAEKNVDMVSWLIYYGVKALCW